MFKIQHSAKGTTFIVLQSGSGNTLTTVDTNFKVATFTGPGTFTVSSWKSCAKADYLVIAGRWWRWYLDARG
jgi:hypothetical protein